MEAAEGFSSCPTHLTMDRTTLKTFLDPLPKTDAPTNIYYFLIDAVTPALLQ